MRHVAFVTNAIPITFNVSFQLFLESHFLFFQNSSPFHYLLTSLTQKVISLFLLLIIIILLFFLPVGHYMAQGHFTEFENKC